MGRNIGNVAENKELNEGHSFKTDIFKLSYHSHTKLFKHHH